MRGSGGLNSKSSLKLMFDADEELKLNCKFVIVSILWGY